MKLYIEREKRAFQDALVAIVATLLYLAYRHAKEGFTDRHKVA